MKTYMNAKEKNDFVMLCALIGYTEGMIEEWKNNLTKDEKKYIRMSTAFITKATDSIMNRMDSNFGKQLARLAKDSQIFCMPNEKAAIRIQKQQAESENERVKVRRVALEDLAEKALGNCDPCRQLDHTQCSLKKLLIELHIEPIDLETTGCGYMMSKIKEVV